MGREAAKLKLACPSRVEFTSSGDCAATLAMSSSAEASAASGHAAGAAEGSGSDGQPLAAIQCHAGAAGSTSGAAIVPVPEPGGPRRPLNDRIAELKREQAAQAAERTRIAKELRNEERKRKRLREKAKLMTDEDLLQVLRLRQDRRGERLQAAPDPAANAAASGAAGAPQTVPLDPEAAEERRGA